MTINKDLFPSLFRSYSKINKKKKIKIKKKLNFKPFKIWINTLKYAFDCVCVCHLCNENNNKIITI